MEILRLFARPDVLQFPCQRGLDAVEALRAVICDGRVEQHGF